jgi:predicted dehydrogenase
MSILRWGILGPAGIARKNWQAIRLSGNGVLTAVASRQKSRAQSFIDALQAQAPFPTAPVAVEGYAELLRRDDIDAVYVPLPTGLRQEWVLAAAAAGKHVVCEKPCAPTAAELRILIEACRSARVQFLDGLMFAHGLRWPRILAALNSGEAVGQIRRISSAFTFLADPAFATENIRADHKLEPLGCLGDLGWYNVRFTLEALGGRMPHRVTARCHAALGRSGAGAEVPADFTAELEFAGGATASFHCSFQAAMQQWALVSGTTGTLRVDDFVLPYRGSQTTITVDRSDLAVDGCQFKLDQRTERIVVEEHSDGHETAQETNLFRNFAAQVASGRLNEEWTEWAWRTQTVVEQCLLASRESGRS